MEEVLKDPKKDPSEKGSANERKWTKSVLATGYTIVPSLLLEWQRELDLDAVDVNILLHLMRHWWEPAKLPFPAKRSIAHCMQLDPSTIRRRIAALEARGLVKRIKRTDPVDLAQTSNSYDLSGLVEELGRTASMAQTERRKRRQRWTKASPTPIPQT